MVYLNFYDLATNLIVVPLERQFKNQIVDMQIGVFLGEVKPTYSTNSIVVTV